MTIIFHINSQNIDKCGEKHVTYMIQGPNILLFNLASQPFLNLTPKSPVCDMSSGDP